jgi:ubiquinone/menaquinone biosynthesis C-methylase UbiE
MTRDIDLLTSPILTHLRDRWWDAAFTEFVRDTLRPEPGEQVLEVGCGGGIAELMLRLLEPGGVRHYGIDIDLARIRLARGAARDHNLPLGHAAADIRALPFAEATFDATFEIGVLQHLPEATRAIAELARVTQPYGRVLLVEPDNSTRYWFSSLASGRHAFDLSTQYFAALAHDTHTEHSAPVSEAGLSVAGLHPHPRAGLGPHLPALCRAHGIEAIGVHVFPVTSTRLGAPVPTVWNARKRVIRAAVNAAPTEETRAIGSELIDAVDRYAEEGSAAGPAFVEIQNTMLFAIVGQRRGEPHRERGSSQAAVPASTPMGKAERV